MLSLPTLAHPLSNADESPAAKQTRHAIAPPVMTTECSPRLGRSARSLNPSTCPRYDRSLADPLQERNLAWPMNDRQRQQEDASYDCGYLLPKVLRDRRGRRLARVNLTASGHPKGNSADKRA